MKISRIGLVVVLAAILVCASSLLCQAEEMTKGALASILVNRLGIELPAGAENLSDADFYGVEAKLLAERGIALFEKAKSNWRVFSCDLANVLYDALVGKNEASIFDKFEYLAGRGYMASSTDYKCEIMDSEDVLSILNIPELSSAIAQAYSAPNVFAGATGAGAGVGGGTEIPPAPENPNPEGFFNAPPPEPPASPVSG